MLLPKVIFLSALIPLYDFLQPSPFVESQRESLQEAGVPIISFYIQGKGFLKYPKAIRPLQHFIECNKSDLIHAHYSYSGALGLSQKKIPVVLSLLGGDLGEQISRNKNFLPHFLAQLTALAVNQVIVKSEKMKSVLWRKQGVHVIPNGINLKNFQPMNRKKARQALSLDKEKTIVLFPASQYREVKDYPLANKAFQDVKKRFPDSKLLTIESVPREIMPLYINAADVVLFTSKSEGSPNVIKEAMACNVPIVTVDVGDTRKVVEGTAQCWVTSRNPDELSLRLIEVLQENSPTNGRERIQEYDQKIIANRLIKIYQETVKK